MPGSVTEGADPFKACRRPWRKIRDEFRQHRGTMAGMLSDEQFERIRRLARLLAGFELFDRHRELLVGRLRRLGMGRAEDIDPLLGAAEEGEPDATRRFVALLTTKHTGFFRHPAHFDAAAEHLLWAAHRSGRARAWCAAAATGEEPYSLAMALIEVFRRDDPPVTVLATDIDDDALALARRAEYGERALCDLGPERRARFLAPAATESRWEVAARARDLVEFRTLNLVETSWPLDAPFDIPFDAILCRNVLMYLVAAHRAAVLERIASALSPDGLLLIDPTEHLGEASHRFAPRAAGVYARRGAPSRGASTRPPMLFV